MRQSMCREKKQAIRRKILFLTRDDTWMNNPKIVKEVQKQAKLLSSNRLEDKRPLPKLNPDKLIKKDYQYLLDFGYQVDDIMKALGLGSGVFHYWKKKKFQND
ncbi:hypothetical protein LWX64_002681 [Enterococcus faecalis]|nr:hypothetical protein [Enterococcus faecalis]